MKRFIFSFMILLTSLQLDATKASVKSTNDSQKSWTKTQANRKLEETIIKRYHSKYILEYIKFVRQKFGILRKGAI